jgi:nucleotide-binding universal stress UspA family protein
MGKRVLVAVDLSSSSDSSAFYGIQLAARINSPLALIVISPSRRRGRAGIAQIQTTHMDRGKNPWIDKVVDESQRAGVSLEIFIGSGPFFEEILRFVSSQPSVQFIVMAAPAEASLESGATFASELKRVREAFEGEILLVQKAGHVTRVSDFNLQNSVRETS